MEDLCRSGTQRSVIAWGALVTACAAASSAVKRMLRGQGGEAPLVVLAVAGAVVFASLLVARRRRGRPQALIPEMRRWPLAFAAAGLGGAALPSVVTESWGWLDVALFGICFAVIALAIRLRRRRRGDTAE
ncbi:hypothetical protein [Arthrobacter sp. UM1]|uniref:hypothetical protein n=1 Tax=Arthrobacter sp. UM1 TaxID=2766776 RepID=UPI001CF61930|nr:hypothetical protein [Arthrobacter sp. UM1]MCB4208237.1 hypothetical protein [Arthrobacter sp. UM1]